MNATKLITILDPQKEQIKEEVLTGAQSTAKAGGLFDLSSPYRPSLLEVYRKLQEANNTSMFPSLLRDGLRGILFDEYAAVPQTWQAWARTQASDRQFEDYIEGSHIGLLPKVAEGDPYPHITLQLDRTLQIRNDKRGGIIQVTDEMIRFDKVGIIRDQAADLGRALGMTKEQDAYNVLTTAGNYVRTIAAGDNDYGNNTAATTFDADGMELALSVLRSMKDNKTGRYLGVMPNTLVCGPRLEFAAKQLLLAPQLQRASANNAAESYGTGTDNPFRGLVNSIIVSPFIQSYAWVLMEAGRAVVMQEVYPLELTQTSMTADSGSWLNFDVIEYKAREMYGVGMKNDRFAYYSSSSTAPTVG